MNNISERKIVNTVNPEIFARVSFFAKLIALLNLSSWCLVMVEQLFLAVPRGCLQFVIVVFPDHTHLLFSHMHMRSFMKIKSSRNEEINLSFTDIGKSCPSRKF